MVHLRTSSYDFDNDDAVRDPLRLGGYVLNLNTFRIVRRSSSFIVLSWIIAVVIGYRHWAAASPPVNKAGTTKNDGPAVKQVAAWKYRLIRPSFRFTPQNETESITVPEREMGYLWLDVSGGRVVYRFYDDKSLVSLIRRFGLAGADERRKAAEPLISSAGSDGQKFWLAHFRPYQAEPQFAHEVHVYGSQEILERDDDKNWPKWYHAAPLHTMLRQIGTRGWDYDSLTAALSRSEFVTENKPSERIPPPPGTRNFLLSPWDRTKSPARFRRGGGAWEYVIEVDREPAAIRQCHVELSGGWHGVWPYPTPSRYHLVRDSKACEVPEKAFTFDPLVGKKTSIKTYDH